MRKNYETWLVQQQQKFKSPKLKLIKNISVTNEVGSTQSLINLFSSFFCATNIILKMDGEEVTTGQNGEHI